jgi:Na+/proline symporter
LLNYASVHQIALPVMGDDILPMFVSNGYLGVSAVVFFVIGIIAVTFASADSALTGLTTSVCVDLLNISRYDEKKARKIRISIHFLLSLVFIAIMLLFKAINNTSVIDALYMIVSYTYGPLLGLFAFGILFKSYTNDRFVPIICILSPVLCFILSMILKNQFNYQLGYELLIINASFVIFGLWGMKGKITK